MNLNTFDLLQQMNPTQLNEAMVQLGTSLRLATSLNAENSQVTIDEIQLGQGLTRSFPLAVAGNALRSIRDVAAGGVAVVDGRAVAPWNALTASEIAPALDPHAVRLALQIGDAVPSTSLPLEIVTRFADVSSTIATELGQMLSTPASPELSLKNNDTGEGEGPGGGGGVGGAVLLTIQELVQCFARATWEVNWWGVSVGFDAPCAKAIGTALTGASAPFLLTALEAGIAAGGPIFAAIGAAAAAVGGWIILGIVLNAFLTGNLILGSVTANGVWVETSWIGPIVWARGR